MASNALPSHRACTMSAPSPNPSTPPTSHLQPLRPSSAETAPPSNITTTVCPPLPPQSSRVPTMTTTVPQKEQEQMPIALDKPRSLHPRWRWSPHTSPSRATLYRKYPGRWPLRADARPRREVEQLCIGQPAAQTAWSPPQWPRNCLRRGVWLTSLHGVEITLKIS